jgi:hypothetical protein
MPEITITENGVEKVLQNLNPNKACGLDELTPRLLKELAHELTPIVTMIFQRSLELGKTPSDWKHAIAVCLTGLSCLKFHLLFLQRLLRLVLHLILS